MAKFGCTAYALKLPSGGKLDSKDAKAYKLYDSSTRKTIVSRDVKFVEKGDEIPDQQPLVEMNENDCVTLRLNLADDKSLSQVDLEENDENLSEQATIQEQNLQEESHTAVELIKEEIVQQHSEPTEPEVVEEQSEAVQPEAVEEAAANVEDAIRPRPKNVSLTSGEYIQFVCENSNIKLVLSAGRPEMVRGKTGRPQKRYHYELTAIYIEPTRFNEAAMSDDCDQWMTSMQQEYLSQIDNGTWTLVQKPENAKVLSIKWVYKVKTDENGNNMKYKSRLCIRKKDFEKIIFN